MHGYWPWCVVLIGCSLVMSGCEVVQQVTHSEHDERKSPPSLTFSSGSAQPVQPNKSLRHAPHGADHLKAVEKGCKDCRSEQVLAPKIARLLVMNVHALLHLSLSKHIEGSFASSYAMKNRSFSDNQRRLTLFAVRSVPVNLDSEHYRIVRDRIDDMGNRLHLGGTITRFNGELVRSGIPLMRTIKVADYNKVSLERVWHDRQELTLRSDRPDSTTITLHAVVDTFHAVPYQAAHKNPDVYALVNQGSFSLIAHPFMGMDTRTKHHPYPSYSIATPIVLFKQIVVEDAKITLHEPMMKLSIMVKKARLAACNGRYAGQGNYVEGDIEFGVIDDANHIPTKLVTIVLDRQDLEPTYDQHVFDQRYARTPYLDAVLQ